MAGQHFSLKWHSFANHLAFAFDTLRAEENININLCDVTLCCEGKRIRAHKLLLSVCSTYFRETFFENPCKHPVIIFKNVKHQDLLSIVEFMYKGEVSIAQDSLSSFLHVAEMLQVRGLSESQDLLPTITEKNIITTPVTTQTESQSLFISVPEGNKILFTTPAITTQHVPELMKSPLRQQQQQQIQQQTQQVQVQIQQKKSEFLDQTGINLKRKRPSLKENRSIRTNNNTTQYVTETLENFNKQETTTTTMIVDENGKESVYEEVEYLTMKNEMPEYMVPNIENSEQNNQDNIEETTTFIQETFEIIEDPRLEGGKTQTILTEDGTTTTTNIDNQQEAMSIDDANENKMEEGKGSGDAGTSKWTQCQYCKLVITSVNLWRHVRTQHTSQPPRKCEYCKKTFKNKYSLREHVRISHESKQNLQKLLSSDPEDLPGSTSANEGVTEATTTTTTTISQQSTQQQEQQPQITKVIYLENIS